jgi:hypothetical protein
VDWNGYRDRRDCDGDGVDGVPLYARFAQRYEKVGSANSGFYLDEFALGPVLVPAKNLLVLRMGAREPAWVQELAQRAATEMAKFEPRSASGDIYG